MGVFLLKWLVLGIVGLVVWDAGYNRGKSDLWDFLARNYIVLHKCSYSCSKAENKQKNKRKIGGPKK